MSKNSRPDIQVLESRVNRLKDQLLEYKDCRIYEITRKRLRNVSNELQECISILDEVLKEGQSSSSSIQQNIYDVEPITETEFGDVMDNLDDVFKESSKKESPYSPKVIIANFANRLDECSNLNTGVIQINQFTMLLNSWFKARFIPSRPNPNFHYRADRIHEWIDLLILASGKSIHDKTFVNFLSDMESWMTNLGSESDKGWMLPKSVMDMRNGDPSSYVKESILIEQVVKSNLYSIDFYPTELYTVKEIVKEKTGLKDEDLSLGSIVKTCKGFIITSSFDLERYQEAV